MNVTTYYNGLAPRCFELDQAFWPYTLDEQARVAISLWLGSKPRTGSDWRWWGQIQGIETVGDRVKVNVGGTQTFDYEVSNIGGPW